MSRALRRGIVEVPNSSEAHAALAQLNARLARLESVRSGLEKKHVDQITHSLFVRYGAAILNEPEELVALSQDPEGAEPSLGYDELRLSLNCLCEWLLLLKIMPRRVFCMEDLDSQIIARALARQLDAEWTHVEGGNGFTHSKSLIVSADNRALLAPALHTIFPSQVVFAVNLKREGGAIMPDVCGFSKTDLLLPWHEERISTRKIAYIVDRLLDKTSLPPSESWPSRLEFYRSRRGLLSAGNSCYSRLSMLPENI